MTRIRNSTKRARALRSASTDAERALWRVLRGVQLVFKFRRQYVVHPFIVDFICLERRLIVEVDGAQHAEQQAQYDAARDRFLKREGFRVLRFSDRDVLTEVESVTLAIRQALTLPPP